MIYYKILESPQTENEYIDAAAFNNFTASGKSGIVRGILNECRLYKVDDNTFYMSPGELLIYGFRIKITQAVEFTVINQSPAQWYSLIGRITVKSDKSVSFEIVYTTSTELVQNDLYKQEQGVYEVRIGIFRATPYGIMDLERRIDVISVETLIDSIYHMEAKVNATAEAQRAAETAQAGAEAAKAEAEQAAEDASNEKEAAIRAKNAAEEASKSAGTYAGDAEESKEGAHEAWRQVTAIAEGIGYFPTVVLRAEQAASNAENFAKIAEDNMSGAGMYAGDAENAAMATSDMLRSFKFSYDHEQGILTVTFKSLVGDTYGESSLVDTSVSIDLPLESSIVDIQEDNDGLGTPVLRLTLANGVERTVSLAGLVSGLVSSESLAERFPENIGSSSHRIYIAPPEGYTIDGQPVKGYLKRIAGYDGSNKSSSNGTTGIITKTNRQQKFNEGLINEAGFENYATHGEPTDISIACRDKDGRLVIEDGEKPFHAVNNRQLAKVKEETANIVLPYKVKSYPTSSLGESGWYRIAQTIKNGISCSSLFKITVMCGGGRWSDLIITAAQCFDDVPQIGILSHQKRGGGAVRDIRIVYDTQATDKNGYLKTSSYLEILLEGKVTEVVAVMLGDPASIYSGNDRVAEWTLTDISLTTTLETNYVQFSKSANDTVWADVTASSTELNAVSTIANKADKTYVDNKFDGVNAGIINLIALANQKQTRAIDMRPYFEEFAFSGDNNTLNTIDVFSRNTLHFSIDFHDDILVTGSSGEELLCERSRIYMTVIPRKPLGYHTPVECAVVSGLVGCDYILGTDYMFQSTTLNCVLEFVDTGLWVRVYGEGDVLLYMGDNDPAFVRKATFDSLLQVCPSAYIDYLSATVLLTEEVLEILPSTYSMRRDMTDAELKMFEKMNT